ncbi:MAG: hypothetical protein CBB68_12705 [Rhodospirillaceae bacterium TMED8]|nr:hypothetical protein [Magnetovibrio sp.]OUT48969.1 MAG: hypothetical protein CBB68_12705 [Rhodospirillaceae bacterium TMED8]
MVVKSDRSIKHKTNAVLSNHLKFRIGWKSGQYRGLIFFSIRQKSWQHFKKEAYLLVCKMLLSVAHVANFNLWAEKIFKIAARRG